MASVTAAPSGPIAKWHGWAPYFASILRIAAAFGFMQHGTAKLFAFPQAMAPGAATADPFTLLWVAGVLETFGGALMLLGLCTRPVAFLLSGQMAVAYFSAHSPNGFWPTMNGGELAVLYCFAWLYYSAAGAGPISVDALIRKR